MGYITYGAKYDIRSSSDGAISREDERLVYFIIVCVKDNESGVSQSCFGEIMPCLW